MGRQDIFVISHMTPKAYLLSSLNPKPETLNPKLLLSFSGHLDMEMRMPPWAAGHCKPHQHYTYPILCILLGFRV